MLLVGFKYRRKAFMFYMKSCNKLYSTHPTSLDLGLYVGSILLGLGDAL